MNELEALTLALEREHEANKNYSDAANKTTSASAKKTFSWLASEEQGHIKILEKLCGQLKESGKWLTEQEWCACGDISSPVQCSEFPSSSEARAEFAEDAAELDILRKAIEDERQAIKYYADLAEKTSDAGGKDMLNKLSAIEQGHLDLLEEEYEWLSKSKSMFTIHRFGLH